MGAPGGRPAGLARLAARAGRRSRRRRATCAGSRSGPRRAIEPLAADARAARGGGAARPRRSRQRRRAARLERALLNLLGNAQKYGHDGGRICLRVERRATARRCSRSRTTARASRVADQPRVFERFYRSDSRDDARISGQRPGAADRQGHWSSCTAGASGRERARGRARPSASRCRWRRMRACRTRHGNGAGP